MEDVNGSAGLGRWHMVVGATVETARGWWRRLVEIE